MLMLKGWRMRAEATARPFFESRSEKNLHKRRYKKVAMKKVPERTGVVILSA